MSVDVKTPTRTQFEHTEFQCGELQSIAQAAATKKSTNNNNLNSKGQNVSFNDEPPVCSSAHSSVLISPRMRKQSTAFRQNEAKGFQSQGFIRRRRQTWSTGKCERIVLPTQFLLGGNINDPLNLNSLTSSEIGFRLNETTPVSSPVQMPSHRSETVRVVIPHDVSDPLNLNMSEEDLTFGKGAQRKRKRNKGRRRAETSVNHDDQNDEVDKELRDILTVDVELAEETQKATSESALHIATVNVPTDLQLHRRKIDNRIVSPVIPNRNISPVKPRRRRRTMSMSDVQKPDIDPNSKCVKSLLRSAPCDRNSEFEPPKKMRKLSGQIAKQVEFAGVQPSRSRQNSGNLQAKQRPKFIYGNYNRYYGYRNPDTENDARLRFVQPEWIAGKDVLDIGCNVGHVTLAIAQSMRPRKIVGMDIDSKLIGAARKNIRHYLSQKHGGSGKFPSSLAVNYGPIVPPPVKVVSEIPVFPSNVVFVQGNYVLERDELVTLQREEYDVILGLSLTKWIHLNFGDSGIKRVFKRMFRQLRPGGKLILEPQAWPSYKKKKKLTDEIFQTFQSIQFKPDHFTDYLLSREVGFSTCEVISRPFSKAKGFQRPLQLFTKADTAASSPESLAIVTQPDTQSTSTPAPTDTDDFIESSMNLTSAVIDTEREATNPGTTVTLAGSGIDYKIPDSHDDDDAEKPVGSILENLQASGDCSAQEEEQSITQDDAPTLTQPT